MPNGGLAPPPSDKGHRFHANLLLALQRPSCPLFEVLGQGDVMHWLVVAKGWRNMARGGENLREILDANGADGGGWRNAEQMRKLEALDVEGMTRCIVEGLEVAGGVVETWLSERGDMIMRDGFWNDMDKVDYNWDDEEMVDVFLDGFG